jgi:hypothetical protein
LDYRGALERAETLASEVRLDDDAEPWETPESFAEQAAFDTRIAETEELADAWPKAARIIRDLPRHERARYRGLDPRVVVQMHRPRRFSPDEQVTTRARRPRVRRRARSPARRSKGSSDDPGEHDHDVSVDDRPGPAA